MYDSTYVCSVGILRHCSVFILFVFSNMIPVIYMLNPKTPASKYLFWYYFERLKQTRKSMHNELLTKKVGEYRSGTVTFRNFAVNFPPTISFQKLSVTQSLNQSSDYLPQFLTHTGIFLTTEIDNCLLGVWINLAFTTTSTFLSGLSGTIAEVLLFYLRHKNDRDPVQMSWVIGEATNECSCGKISCGSLWLYVVLYLTSHSLSECVFFVRV